MKARACGSTLRLGVCAVAAMALVLLLAAPAADAIKGGQVDAVTQYPWLAQVWLDNEFDCGGSLVRAGWILTAGHCVTERTQSVASKRLTVILGRQRLDGADGEVHRIAAVKLYPSYRLTRDRNHNGFSLGDVALLRLASPSARQAIPLGSQSESSRWQPGSEVAFLGWGSTAVGGPPSQELMRGASRVATQRSCDDAYRPPEGFDYDASVLLCVAAGNGGQEPCNGDSGGPLLTAAPVPTLVGVDSFGYGCRQGAIRPTVYARVADNPLRRWLLSVIAPPPPVYLRVAANGRDVIRPASFRISARTRFRRMHWRSWSRAGAKGSG
ncbi:MAG: hypothetical protein QOD76_275, partial [Solirubrobacteraceae bacterium]|nr:hypothetical protein [Solirubrobacteraceae bacterium]